MFYSTLSINSIVPFTKHSKIGGMFFKFSHYKKKTNPKRSKLSVIAEYLGVSVEDILPDDEEVLPKVKKESAPDPKTEGVSPTVQELFDFIDTATDAELNELLRYAQFLMSKR